MISYPIKSLVSFAGFFVGFALLLKVEAGPQGEFQLEKDIRSEWMGAEILLSRVVRGGEVYDFVRTSPDSYEVRGDDGEKFFKFNSAYPGNSPGLDSPRLLDVFKKDAEIAALFHGNRGYYFVRSSKNPPVLQDGQLHLELKLLAENCWHVNYYASVPDFYGDQGAAIPAESKVASTKVVSLDSIEIVNRMPNGELAKPDVFYFKVASVGIELVKNGVGVKQVMGSSTVFEEEAVADQLLNTREPLPEIKKAILAFSDNKDEFIKKISVVKDGKRREMMVEKINEIFGGSGD